MSELQPSKIFSLHFSLATTHLLKCCVHLIKDVTAIHPFQGDICARNASLRKKSLPSATNNKTKAREYELESECSSTAQRKKTSKRHRRSTQRRKGLRRQPLTARLGFDPRPIQVGPMVGKVPLRRFPLILSVFLC